MNVRSIDNCECAAHLKRKLYKKKKSKMNNGNRNEWSSIQFVIMSD